MATESVEVVLKFVPSGLAPGQAAPASLSAAVSVPAATDARGLSAVVNHLLGEAAAGAEGQQFEFLVRLRDAAPGAPDAASGRSVARSLLRGSLATHLPSLGVSLENIVTLEYTKALAPPKIRPGITQPAAILAVDAGDTCVVTGNADGRLTAYALTASSGVLGVGAHTVIPTPPGVGALTAVSLCEMEGSAVRLMAAGYDGVVRQWQIRADAAGAQPVASLVGVGDAPLSDASTSLRVRPDGGATVAGDASGCVHVCVCVDAGPDAAETQTDSKRKRSRAAAASEHSEPQSLSPHHLLSHSARVGGVAWLGTEGVVSASWDGEIRVTEVEAALSAASSGATVASYTSASGVCSIAASALGSAFITGHMDARLRMWDARLRGGEAAVTADERNGLRAAGKLACTDGDKLVPWVRGVAWNPTVTHYVSAADHAGRVTLWDTRAFQSPVATVYEHSASGSAAHAYATAWGGARGELLLSGGADNMLRCATIDV